ncbi:MAG TPA: aminotransferase class III-fold pyridoxal phosphate-dependent enzyme [Planctomycetota bacterium]|nr:aminotransferase class III-fold pyridoxal phosphate-dependent enzyme [Planctomycetota bacterium]
MTSASDPIDLDASRGAALLGRPVARPPFAPRADLAAALASALRARFGFGPWHLFASRGAAVAALLEASRGRGRDEVVRFRGCRHLHDDDPEADPKDADAWRPVVRLATLGDLDASGFRRLRFNDAATLEAHLERSRERVGAVLVEPVPLRMSVAPPAPDFLPRARAASSAQGTWLVFDEGASGLRFGARGTAARVGAEPDAIVLGEALASGSPLGAVALRDGAPGKEAADASLAAGAALPDAGAMAEALGVLEATAAPGFHARLDALGARLAVGLDLAASGSDRPAEVVRFGSAVALVFPKTALSDPSLPARYDRDRYLTLTRRIAAEGVRMSPHPMDPLFLSAMHSLEDIDRATLVFRRALEDDDDSIG